MKIAIPVSGDRVSPVFDTARRVLLVDVDEDRPVERTEMSLEEPQLTSRANRIAEWNAEVLICGAISRPLEAMLLAAGVDVVPQTCGQVEDVIRAFVSGSLADDRFAMPGCCGRRRQHRGRQRRAERRCRPG